MPSSREASASRQLTKQRCSIFNIGSIGPVSLTLRSHLMSPKFNASNRAFYVALGRARVPTPVLEKSSVDNLSARP